mgnify:CR=1 FL=1
MTYEEKINWLFRYREAERLYQRLSYRLAEAQEATRHITQNLSAAPGGSKDGQSLARAVEREEEAERRAYAQLAVLDALFAELDSAEYCALRKYYLDCLKWEQVAADMNFTSRGIFALRRRAIEHLKL